MSKMLKKVISLFIMTCLISSSMGTFVFAENLGEKTIESEKICLEKDLDLETVVSLANELIPSKDISSEDVIVQESNDGNVRFIVPYNSIKQPIEELNISELMDNLKDDNNVSDINLQDNILTYTIFNNTDVEIIETSLNDEPAFVKQNDINLIFMAGMTEKSQEIVIKKLKPYADRMEELVDKNQPILLLGNAMEIVGKFIENEDDSQIRAVGLYHFYSHRDMMHRYSGYYLGKHKGIEIVGFKAQFTTTYGNNDECYFAETELGMGINIGTKYEGVQKNNLISTSILGPILILNPLFTKELLKTMGVKEPKLAFEEEVMAAYNERLKKFKKMTEKEKKNKKNQE